MEKNVPAKPVRIVLTGSESVGKTTLAEQLAMHYGVEAVPEYVRQYVHAKGAPLDFKDHGPIARGQMAIEDEYLARASELLIQDTDLISTVVYCNHYFGKCPAFIEEAAVARVPSLYLLLDIDVPWVHDGVRDRGDRRSEVQREFIDTLTRLNAPVANIAGTWTQRFDDARSLIDGLLTDGRVAH